MRKAIVLLFISCTGLFTGCVSTQLIGSLKVSDAEPKQYKNLGVVVLSPKTYNRATVEMAVADDLRSRGIKAIATSGIFPFAGKMDQVKGDMTQEQVQEKVRERVTSNNVDALLTITLLDKEKETRYVQGSSFSVAAPAYGYSYYGYYGYAYNTIYTPGYYTTSTKYFIEVNLYDVATEKLLWTGQTKTEDPTSLETEAAKFAKLVVDEMLAKKVLTP